MKNYGKVSIIIPVYKVEKYLADCLESICRQSYSNLEILVVDDGSPDQSGIIADRLASKDIRIKVFHETNRGAAGARNIALNHATGEYIAFVDSDDWVELDYVETMLEALVANNADIVQCQYIDETVNTECFHCYHEGNRNIDSEQYIEEMLSHWEYVLMWNKLYKQEIIGDTRIPEGHCIDDEFYTYKVVMNARKIHLVKDTLYHYRLRKSSAMGDRKKKIQRYKDQVDFITDRYQPLSTRYPRIKSKILTHMICVLLEVMRRSAWHEESFLYAKKKLKKYSGLAIIDKNVPSDVKKSIVLFLFKNRKQLVNKSLELKEENQADYYL